MDNATQTQTPLQCADCLMRARFGDCFADTFGVPQHYCPLKYGWQHASKGAMSVFCADSATAYIFVPDGDQYLRGQIVGDFGEADKLEVSIPLDFVKANPDTAMRMINAVIKEGAKALGCHIPTISQTQTPTDANKLKKVNWLAKVKNLIYLCSIKIKNVFTN